MPRRKHLFANGEYYHIFNRSLGHLPIFESSRSSNHFLKTYEYYLQESPEIKFSLFTSKNQLRVHPPYLVSTHGFIIMPNHFHFILRQETDGGISKFMRKISDSFSHYYNLKNNRLGPLFESRFKSVHIETREQLIHLNRYIHLNSTTAYLVDDPYDYYFSSYRDFVGLNRYYWLDKSVVMSYFKTKEAYKTFVSDNIDYQRSLRKLKHLTLD